MRDVELKLLSELMKNSRRSDRELAKAIGVSQPTVTRVRTKFEKEGYVKEYTALPDFAKIGYEISAITFVKLKQELDPQEVEKAREIAKKDLMISCLEVIMVERGIGLEFNGVFISFHENYASYLKFKEWLRQYSFLEISKHESYLISMSDEIHYRPLTFSTLAKHLLTLTKKKEKQ